MLVSVLYRDLTQTSHRPLTDLYIDLAGGGDVCSDMKLLVECVVLTDYS